MPDTSGAIDLSASRPKERLEDLTAEEQAAVDALADSTEPSGHQVRTAFIVYVEQDGNVQVTPDLDTPFIRQYTPGADDVYGALHAAAKTIAAEETAVATVQVTQQVAASMQQQMQNARIAQQVQQGLAGGR